MPSNDREPSSDLDPADAGLLAPVVAGARVEALTGDAAFVRGLLDAEAALTRAQAALGFAPPAAAAAVTAVAGQTSRFDVRDLALRARSGGNPVIPLVADLTAAVAERDPEAAPYVHRGATSQDIWDTAAMLVTARALEPVLADLDRTAAALARLAAAHRDTPMPGRTLTQHAVPTTFGLKAAGWRSLVTAARDRLAAVRAALPVQLGGAAGTLAAFREYSTGSVEDVLRLPAAYAAETGLAEPALPWHTLRTPVADLAGALAFAAGALGKLAADVLVLSRTEIGEVSVDAGGGSSAMPQKANPVGAVLIAAAARQVPALAATLYGSLAAEDERPPGAWHAEWRPMREALRLVGGAAAAAAELRLRVHTRRMRGNLDLTGGLIVSERIGAALAAEAGRDHASRIVGSAVRAVRDGADLVAALLADPAVAAAFSEERLRELTDPARYTGLAGALVDRALGPSPGRSQNPSPGPPPGREPGVEEGR